MVNRSVGEDVVDQDTGNDVDNKDIDGDVVDQGLGVKVVDHDVDGAGVADQVDDEVAVRLIGRIGSVALSRRILRLPPATPV